MPELLLDYANWRPRFVGQRPRVVTVEPGAQASGLWAAHAPAIQTFLGKVERGEDLDPHLSNEPRTLGYTPAARVQGAPPADRWSDKDFLLNVMGCHHFHLETAPNRTDELIFARVGRDNFHVIDLFGHDVFDLQSPERARLWALHDSIATRGAAPGAVVVGALIATSGDSLRAVAHAAACGRKIAEFEPKLDDPEFVKGLYSSPGDAPAKSNLDWWFTHLDLALYDASKPGVLIVQKGWN